MDITTLIPQFGSLFTTILAFVVALSVIVAIHEYGHYIVGRWSGIKAEVFSLGFGPVLFSRMDKHGTRWQFALLPFGGYVKFLGDANAASANTDDSAVREMTPEMRRQTMQGAPLWARSATVAAGPIFNFILSIVVFAGLMMFEGKIAEPLVVGEVFPMPGEEITLQPGDQLLAIEGIAVPSFEESGAFDALIEDVPVAPRLTYSVNRDGDELDVTGPYPMPPRAVNISPQSSAYAIDMKQGDVITSVDGTPISAFSELKDIVETSNGRALQLKVWRDGELIDFALAPRRVDEPQPEGGFKTSWRIGISGGLAFEPATERLGFGDAIAGGFERTGQVIETSLSGLYHLIAGKISSCNMTGPIGIAQVSGAMVRQGADSFILFIAFLSTAVGLLNLFPIPVLDGGHLVFYAYEAVAGKPPSETALRVLMTIGLTLILGIMAFAIGTDLFCA
ncbi:MULTISPECIES: RIP metalloprotease RseP [unclassified Roseovarius]|uniref:RIP metalloprotease RseP n=1 Tax=unclassified Roseovarius TaxID=2614913 RepID=UPI00273D2B32|nr:MULTISPECIES: RIP metalloprotease RseP [unclassified Roseovarius]